MQSLAFYLLRATFYILIWKISIKVSLCSSSFSSPCQGEGISNLCSESSNLIINPSRFQYNISSLVSANFVILQEEISKGKVVDFKPNILMLGLPPSVSILCAVLTFHTNNLEQTLLVSAVTFVH